MIIVATSCPIRADTSVLDVPRRTLNVQEAERLIHVWRRDRSIIDEPLHVWLGWTEEELENYEEYFILPR